MIWDLWSAPAGACVLMSLAIIGTLAFCPCTEVTLKNEQVPAWFTACSASAALRITAEKFVLNAAINPITFRKSWQVHHAQCRFRSFRKYSVRRSCFRHGYARLLAVFKTFPDREAIAHSAFDQIDKGSKGQRNNSCHSSPWPCLFL